MANPQLNKGHTRIANEILENVMKLSLNGTQYRIVICIWRFTYGFQRKLHEMSIRFIANAINASRGQVDRELSVLIDRNIIKIVQANPRKPRIVQFNKNYEEWKAESMESASKRSKIHPPKIKKSTQPKKRVYEEDNTYFKMAVYFHKRVSVVAEEAGVQHLIAKVNLQNWADDMRKLVEIDEVDKRLVKNVMDWVTTDEFWKTNVLSAKKLREKFADLALKMNASRNLKQQAPQKQTDPRDKELEFQQWVQEGNDPDEFDWGKPTR